MNSTPSDKLISASLLRLRMRSPFFAVLALFARFCPTDEVVAAATDGQTIYFNPAFIRTLPSAQQDGLLLHEVLHAALLHVLRRGTREPVVWNIAADIVINGAIAELDAFELPPGGIRLRDLEHLSTEEVYELLWQKGKKIELTMPDLLATSPLDGEMEGTEDLDTYPLDEERRDTIELTETWCTCGSKKEISTPEASDSLHRQKQAKLETYWRNAIQQASTIARTISQGKLPAGLEREMGAIASPQLDWRSYLWRYLVQTPTDFIGWDRRFIGRKLYLETLEGESVRVFIGVDTSGSISPEQLTRFLAEVLGIMSAYPHLKGELYYVDAQAYGPFPLEEKTALPKPQGGGGTSFVPFFEQVESHRDGLERGICVYLTDGYGTFPKVAPSLPVLWVVTPGGLDLRQFPFGEAVRLLDNA